jgi:ketosteroid isomerase-like protein
MSYLLDTLLASAVAMASPVAAQQHDHGKTEIERLGDHAALGRETYRYRIELTDGRVLERKGVATSVLTHEPGGNWKIQRYHSSSRAL